ncbi:hypothetical protein BD414DRAFT_484002 [Trametes punicea]|nr:hypothetical protein BD414DRAFT_484002 [Trametes punicea]
MPFSQFHPLQRQPRTGEPYIRLPAPFTHIIITPPRREDVPHIVSILEQHAEEWVARTRERSDAVLHELRVAEEEQPEGPLAAVGGCPVSCLRWAKEDGTHYFLGAVEFSRCNFPDVRDRAEQERLISRNESRQTGDEEIVWCIGDYLRAELHGAGIMSCALRTLMQKWAIPRMRARRMRAETIAGNWASIRVLEKLGFRICNAVAVRRVTSAGELIEGYHVLWWEMPMDSETGPSSRGLEWRST